VSELVDVEDLIDAHDVATILGLAHANSVATYLHRYADMPRPLLDLGRGRPRLWSRNAVIHWAGSRRRRGPLRAVTTNVATCRAQGRDGGRPARG